MTLIALLQLSLDIFSPHNFSTSIFIFDVCLSYHSMPQNNDDKIFTNGDIRHVRPLIFSTTSPFFLILLDFIPLSKFLHFFSPSISFFNSHITHERDVVVPLGCWLISERERSEILLNKWDLCSS